MADAGEFVGTKEAAEILGVSKARVDQFCREGRLPFEFVGNTRVLRRADVLAFKRQKRKPGKPKKGGGE